MHPDYFNRAVNAQIKKCLDVLGFKADEYATEDRIHNFRVASGLQGITDIQALGGMMAKHTISIYDLINNSDELDTTEYALDLWEEKITDHINYLLILSAMVSEIYGSLPRFIASDEVQEPEGAESGRGYIDTRTRILMDFQTEEPSIMRKWYESKNDKTEEN